MITKISCTILSDTPTAAERAERRATFYRKATNTLKLSMRLADLGDHMAALELRNEAYMLAGKAANA